MKTIVAALIALTTLAGCADNKVLDVPTYNPITEQYTVETREIETYGFLNKEELKDPCVNYSLSTGNVIWSVVAAPGIVFPTYFVGFSLYEPDSVKTECLKKI